MDRTRRFRPGQRMATKSLNAGRGRLSRTAALVALLAVAVLAATAVGLIGGGAVALAHWDLDVSGPADRSPTGVRVRAEPPLDPHAMPQVAPEAEEAQPISTF